MRSCVVTGASGLIGSHLLEALRPNWAISAVSRTPLAPTSEGMLQHLPVDLAGVWSPSVLPPKVDAVVHLAQSEHFREFPERASEVFQVNTASTLALLDYAHRAGAKTFVLASSGGIYGHGDQEFTEDMVTPPQGDLGFYLGTKLCAEVLAENYVRHMNVIVLRFFFVYGPGQRQNMLIPRLIRSVREGTPITLQGPEGIRINPTHVSDAAEAILRAMELSGSHKINVAGPEVLSLRDIGNAIGQRLGREPVFLEQADTVPHHLVGDIRRMAQILTPPVVRFKDGVVDLLSSESYDQYPPQLQG